MRYCTAGMKKENWQGGTIPVHGKAIYHGINGGLNA
jgi:hypothetical protein